MEEYPTLEDLKTLRVVDLKKYLSEFGLSQSGVKADLAQRLFEYYEQKKAEAGSGEDGGAATEAAIQGEEESPEGAEEEVEGEEQENEEEEEEEEEEGDEVQEEEVEEAEPEVEQPEPAPQEPEPVQHTEAQHQPEPVPEVEPVQQPTPASPEKEEVQQQQQQAASLKLSFGPPKAHPAGVPPSEHEATPPPAKWVEEEVPAPQQQSSPPKQVSPVKPPAPVPQPTPPQKQPVASAAKQVAVEYGGDDEEEDEDEGDETSGVGEKQKKAKGGAKKNKKKKKKKNRPEQWAMEAVQAQARKIAAEQAAAKSEQEVEVEYIQENLELDPADPLFRTFSKIFKAFKIEEPVEKPKAEEIKEEEEQRNAEELKKVPKMLEDDDMMEEDEVDEEGEPKMSKRKLKKLSRLSVAELKQLVSRPDVVEMHDVTARDPRLLVHLKSTRNTVPVPRHWCFKRKYLQGKRGIEKPPFDLPEFIKKTGIMEMREALQEKEDAKGMKAKQREKVRPKLGKIDIDYQKLHDAFFKWQTKPKMTMHGDLYYEGKEFEIRLKEKKPGDLSDDLRTALGMPVGPNAHKVPPPWLIAMQRYGPPPSYPNLKIPGLNAAIPDGCSFGYHAGGWGKPPVDEAGKPLYGDVFGTSDTKTFSSTPAEEIDQSLWGEMESESEEESDSDEEEDDEEGGEGEGEDGDTGLQTPVVVGADGGLATPSGTTSVGGAGLETPDMIELRKRRIEADMEGGETPSLPYTLIPERRNERIGGSMMGSAHTYDLGKAPVGGGPGGARLPPGPPGARGRAGGAAAGDGSAAVEMALNPEDIDNMDSETMALKAEAALREQQANLAKEDLSDMVAEHAAKQKNKRKRQEAKDEKEKAKKYKEFKF